MLKEDWDNVEPAELRRRAEEFLLAEAADNLTKFPQDSSSLVYELKVHQAELEIQNEELRQGRLEIELISDRYQALYDFAPIGFITLLSDGLIKESNLAAASLLKFERNQLIKRNFQAFVSPSDQTRFFRFLHLLSKTKVQKSEEFIFITGSGQEVDIRLHGIYIKEVLPGSTYRLAFEDITDYRAKQRELEQRENHFRHLAEAMPHLVFTAAADGSPIYVNRRISKYCGFDYSNAASRGTGNFGVNETGSLWKLLVHPDEFSSFDQAWQDAGKARTEFSFETRLKERSGGFRWHIVRASLAEGETPLWFGAAVDIDERKKSEQSLRLADAMKNQFLAMLAHELRNPLAAIKSSLDLQRIDRIPQEKKQWALATADKQVRHFSTIINDLLDISRITFGKVNINHVPLRINQVVNDAVETVSESINERSQNLTVDIKSNAAIFGDAARLSQVFVNLLGNASKYTPRGGTISVLVGQTDRDTVITVQDTGAGIEQTALPYIFDLFYQPERTLARSNGGLGIGLTLVREIVTLHSGKVTALSPGLGKGSTFTVSLPISVEAENVLPRTAPDLVESHSESRKNESRRILLVEDNEDERIGLNYILQDAGHKVQTAANGIDAVALFKESSPEFVLLDIGLPGLDGLQTASAIRREAKSRVVLIALSGYGQPADIERAMKAGFDYYLVKPFADEALSSILQNSNFPGESIQSE